MALHDWPQRWAAAPIFKVKAGKRQIPARHAIADRYRKKYRSAVQGILARMVKEAASRARGGAAKAFGAADLPRWAKALYEAQIKILMQVVTEAFTLTGRELASGRAKKAAGEDGFLLRQVQPSVYKWLRTVAKGQTKAFAGRIQKLMAFAQGYYDEDLGRGMTPAEIADILLEEGLAATEARAEMIARTNTIWAANEGAIQKYEQAGVGAVSWIATEDDLTCFRAHVLVTTSRGDVPISEVHVGDTVRTQTGWGRVSATSRRPYSGAFSWLCAGGRILECTSDHPVFIHGRGFIQARMIRREDRPQLLNDQSARIAGISEFLLLDPKHAPPAGFEIAILPGVPGRVLVPVRSIDFHDEAIREDAEVNAVSSDLGLLGEDQLGSAQCLPESGQGARP
jgi:hypothetical protein